MFKEFSNLVNKQKEYFNSLLPNNKSISYKGGNQPYVYIKIDNFTWIVVEENKIRNSDNIDKETLLKLETVGQAMFNGYKWLFSNPKFLECKNHKKYMFENGFNPMLMFIQ